MTDSDLEMWLIESMPRAFIVIVQMVCSVVQTCAFVGGKYVRNAPASTMTICMPESDRDTQNTAMLKIRVAERGGIRLCMCEHN